MFSTMFALGALLAVPQDAAPEKPSVPSTVARPATGDVVHGELLLKRAGGDRVRTDGAFMNGFSDEQIIARLRSGKDGFPEIETDNVLDLHDVVAALRARTTDLRDLSGSATYALASRASLDDEATKRLVERGHLTVKDDQKVMPVFALYRLETKDAKTVEPLRLVEERDTKLRDKLKRNTKAGYVVFVPLLGLRDGGYEAAFSVDKDIHIVALTVRDKTGAIDPELALAASRFVGKGARGQYDELKAGGAGKAVNELAKPLSDAFLRGMEAVYMFEVAERDYFAFE